MTTGRINQVSLVATRDVGRVNCAQGQRQAQDLYTDTLTSESFSGTIPRRQANESLGTLTEPGLATGGPRVTQLKATFARVSKALAQPAFVGLSMCNRNLSWLTTSQTLTGKPAHCKFVQRNKHAYPLHSLCDGKLKSSRPSWLAAWAESSS